MTRDEINELINERNQAILERDAAFKRLNQLENVVCQRAYNEEKIDFSNPSTVKAINAGVLPKSLDVYVKNDPIIYALYKLYCVEGKRTFHEFLLESLLYMFQERGHLKSSPPCATLTLPDGIASTTTTL